MSFRTGVLPQKQALSAAEVYIIKQNIEVVLPSEKR